MTIQVRMRQVSGVKIIDDQFANIALISKGSFTTNQYDTDVWASQSSSRRYVRVTGAVNPVIAIQCSYSAIRGGGARARRVDRGNGVFDFYFAVPQDGLPPYVVTTIPYFIFDTNPAPKSGVGIVIRNRVTGEIVFDSRQRYMKVLDFVMRTGTFTYNVTRNWNYGYTSDNIAVIQCLSPIYIYSSGDSNSTIEGYTMRTRVSGNTVTVVEGLEWIAYGGVAPWVPTGRFAMIVVDVTGL